jgi:N-ethylmaleimide reductase
MAGLFDRYPLDRQLTLNNRIVMAPLTRTRTSAGDVPNSLMATYYQQRASAGLIVTEATDVSPRSKGYAWTPGIYTSAQIEGWRQVTNAVHRRSGAIFLQTWHVGRMAHSSMMPDGSPPWGATGEPASGSEVFIHNVDGRASFIRPSVPRQMDTRDISIMVQECHEACKNSRLAGFDGVEIHGANGYLLDQFMNSVLNTRTDSYGGQSAQSRTRLILEVVDSAIAALGAGSIGVRVSPFGKFNSMPEDPRTEETLLHLCDELDRRAIAYLHIVYQFMPSGNVEGGTFSEDNLSADLVARVRAAFRRTLIWCGGFTRDTAQAAVENGWADLVAFGRPFIANPDLVERLENDWPLAVADPSTYYTRDGANGYTDFPRYADPGTFNVPARTGNAKVS